MASALKEQKILFLAGTLGQGGAERQLYYIIKSIRQANHMPTPELVVYTKEEFWEEPIRALGVPIYHAGQSASHLQRLLRTLSIIRQSKPDWLFSMHFYTNTYAGLAGRLLGIKSLGSIRNDGYNEYQASGALFGRLHYFLPHRIIANSEHGLKNIEQLLGKRPLSSVLNNVIDEQHFIFNPSKEEEVLLLFIGRLEKQKRADLFIRLIKALVDRGLAVKGLVLGDGLLRVELEKLVVYYNIQHTVQFLGKIIDVMPYFSKSSLLISTSAHEGTSNVVLEAMAVGLPVVALKYDGIEALISDQYNGLLATDFEELVEKTCWALHHSQECAHFAKNARNIIESNFTIKMLPLKIEKMLRGD